MKTTNKKTIEGVNFYATNVGRNAQNELKPLGWEVFTVKRGSATQDANMPPGNEELR